MSEATRYTITVGNNTNVTATTYELNDKQLRQLEALAQSGDISLDKTTGVITAKTSHGLVAAGALMGVSFDELMAVDGLSGKINRGMTHESTMAAISRFSPSDPKQMSLSELMTCMMMMVYMSESERREALQTAKGAQLLIQMDQARMAWAQSREAAERAFANAMLTAVGTICSAVISATMGIAGGIVQSRAAHYNKLAAKAEDDVKKADLAKRYETAKGEQAKCQKDVDDKRSALERDNLRPNDGTTTSDKVATEQAKAGLDIDAELKDTPEHQKLQAANQKVKDLESQIDKMGGVIGEGCTITDKSSKNGVTWSKSRDKIDDLEGMKNKFKEKASDLSAKVNMLQNVGGIGQVVAGSFQLAAAYAQQDAAFLQAEAQLTQAFQGFAGEIVKNIDSSANQALQQMDKLVSSLKEVFRAMYDIECSIARNI